MLKAVALSFFAVFVVIMAAYVWYTAHKEAPATELKRRLRRMAREQHYDRMPDDLRSEILKETPPFEKFIAKIPILNNLDKFIDQCGLKIHPAIFLICMAASLIVPAGVAFVLKGSLFLAAFIGLSTFSAACIYVVTLKKRRMEKFIEQLPEALSMIARSLRAGHSLNSAIELIGTEFAEPIGPLFKTAFDQQRLGLRITDAVAGILQRVESLDFRFFVVVINIHAEIGGNLSDILDKLANTIRERLKLRRQVRVYTAQGRLSGYILAVLPIFAFVAIHYFLLPGYEDVFLKERQGQIILAYAIMSQFIGFLIIKRIINIRI
jgi:tight adherence protein B